MQGDWIIDVLMDLRSFAHQNGLPVLADHLAGTLTVAAAELSRAHAGGERLPSTPDAATAVLGDHG